MPCAVPNAGAALLLPPWRVLQPAAGAQGGAGSGGHHPAGRQVPCLWCLMRCRLPDVPKRCRLPCLDLHAACQHLGAAPCISLSVQRLWRQGHRPEAHHEGAARPVWAHAGERDDAFAFPRLHSRLPCPHAAARSNVLPCLARSCALLITPSLAAPRLRGRRACVTGPRRRAWSSRRTWGRAWCVDPAAGACCAARCRLAVFRSCTLFRSCPQFSRSFRLSAAVPRSPAVS